jgi:hypothetical protein
VIVLGVRKNSRGDLGGRTDQREMSSGTVTGKASAGPMPSPGAEMALQDFFGYGLPQRGGTALGKGHSF